MKIIAVFLLCLNLIACSSNDLRSVVIQYKGYNIPTGESVWIENGSGKLKVMEGKQYSWSGYFRSGDVFIITVVKKNERVRILDTIFINSLDDRIIVCDKHLLTCKDELL